MNLWELSIREAADLIRTRELSPVELTVAYLDRIEALDGQARAYITVLANDALDAASQAEFELGQYRGPLHGIPIAVKDLMYTKGVRTTAGSKIFADFKPDFDATVVERLRDAGAIILGKTNLHEFAFGTTGVNQTYGTPANPWGSDRVPGGSSSGSGVAVAGGLATGALGSDTGGSTRIPASLCGIVGLKPTYGRVSRYGVFPLAWSLDHVGPMTRTVEDAALMLNALTAHDPLDPASSSEPVPDYTQALREDIKGLRVGLPRAFFFDRIDPEVSTAVGQALALMELNGAVVREVAYPMVEHIGDMFRAILGSEAATYHLPYLRTHWDDYSEQVRTRLLPTAVTPATVYLQNQRAKGVMREKVAELFRDIDVLVLPTTPVAAPLLDQPMLEWPDGNEEVVSALGRLTRAFNLTGYPAISVPCGFTSDGLPIGLQMVARPWDEATLLRAAYTYEQATSWHKRRPPEIS